ncbi:hypothetical protein CBR_g40089 [Chara braunii]|uniref:DUF659 domain-containing protein n=1 Tax=Chara braunii TaxID=69332 RepID=A0A388LT12_CHABU|nr:hypothetical protein CBR_g40089 [Chara braunii]|eukprot:GBG85447.1 hypothetical protein CBR_g40089 [Chara braunii]
MTGARTRVYILRELQKGGIALKGSLPVYVREVVKEGELDFEHPLNWRLPGGVARQLPLVPARDLAQGRGRADREVPAPVVRQDGARPFEGAGASRAASPSSGGGEGAGEGPSGVEGVGEGSHGGGDEWDETERVEHARARRFDPVGKRPHGASDLQPGRRRCVPEGADGGPRDESHWWRESMLQRARDKGIPVLADLEDGLAADPAERRQARHRVPRVTQTRLDGWVEHPIQYDLDMAYIRFFVGCGIPFNVARSEWYLALHDVYLSQFRGPYRPHQPGSELLRTTLLSLLYAELDERLRYHRESWSEGVTFMTDSWSTKANRPLCNYLVAGRLGACLYRVEDMFGRERTGAGLYLRWRELILEIGAQHVVAICTDNALANKEAYRLLRNDQDLSLRKITWIPCAAHCCNLMLTHIVRQQWVAQVIAEGRDITLFFWRHSRIAYLLSQQSPPVSLIRPSETWYGTNFIMLRRMHFLMVVLAPVPGRRPRGSPHCGTLHVGALTFSAIRRGGSTWSLLPPLWGPFTSSFSRLILTGAGSATCGVYWTGCGSRSINCLLTRLVTSPSRR